MADTARNDPQVVRQLARDLDKYLRDVESSERTAGYAQRRVEQELAQENRARERKLREAQAAYDACCRTEDADCSGPRRALERAERALAAVHRAERMYAAATAEYSAAAGRFARVRVALSLETTQLLGLIAKDLDAYNRASSAVGTVPSGNGPAVSAPSGGAVTPTGATERIALDTPAGFPDGYAMIPLSALDTAATGGAKPLPADVSKSDLEWALNAFHTVIVPALRLGKDIEYFRARDQDERRCGARSYADTYTWFLGSDEALQVGRQPDGGFTVHNGFHRIAIARQLGLASVPARVVDA
ncbi:hypothetical protein [Nocardia brasiliensis]|uniref:hypothetical protein n=1 Tax=Nocardia brasiliensis TaxID=37326 RepID=UPI003D8C0B92